MAALDFIHALVMSLTQPCQPMANPSRETGNTNPKVSDDGIRDAFIVEARQQFGFPIRTGHGCRRLLEQVERLLHKINVQILIVTNRIEEGIVRLESGGFLFEDAAVSGAQQHFEESKGKSLKLSRMSRNDRPQCLRTIDGTTRTSPATVTIPFHRPVLVISICQGLCAPRDQ